MPGVEWAKMVVDSVRDDGTVNLRQGETIYAGIFALTSYVDRKAGDTVTVVRSTAGWCVVGKVGAEWAPPAPDPLDVDWGSGPPAGSGWVSGTVWVRDGAIWVQTADPTPPPSASKPVTLPPTSQGAWRDGHRDNDQSPTQGAWPSYPHPYTGGWFYGTTVVAACSGKSVAGMKLRVARSATRSGSFGGVRPILYLLSATTAPSATPALGDGPFYGPALALGVSATFDLPGNFRAALASGAAHGVGIAAGVGSSYLVATSGCGQLTITFN